MPTHLLVGTFETPQGIQNIHMGFAKWYMIHRRPIPSWYVRWSPGYPSETALNLSSVTIKGDELYETAPAFFLVKHPQQLTSRAVKLLPSTAEQL